jgi:Ion channel
MEGALPTRKRSPTRFLIVGLLTSVLLSVGSSFVVGQYLNDLSAWAGLAVLLLWLASFVVAALVTVAALVLSFRRGLTTATQVRVILLSYLGAILVFTGLYFSMALIGDRDYAHAHYFYYRAYADSFKTQVSTHEIAVTPFDGNQRAFIGIEARLLGTLDDALPLASPDFQMNPQAYRVQSAGRREFEDVVRFKPNAVPWVLLDCLHLSIMTIATVGYGNVAPNAWYAKLATNAEALTGTALLVVALALLLARTPHVPAAAQQIERERREPVSQLDSSGDV